MPHSLLHTLVRGSQPVCNFVVLTCLQVTRYAALHGIKYVALSNYEGTVFGMFRAPNELLLSNLIRFGDMTPSVLQVKKCCGSNAKQTALAAAKSEHHVPDDAVDDSDHGPSHGNQEAGSAAGKQGKRKRGATSESSSAGCRLPHVKTASMSLGSVFKLSAIVPFLQQQWQEQKEGQHMSPDLEASAAAFCLADICGVVGKGASGRVFAARCV